MLVFGVFLTSGFMVVDFLTSGIALTVLFNYISLQESWSESQTRIETIRCLLHARLAGRCRREHRD